MNLTASLDTTTSSSSSYSVVGVDFLGVVVVLVVSFLLVVVRHLMHSRRRDDVVVGLVRDRGRFSKSAQLRNESWTRSRLEKRKSFAWVGSFGVLVVAT